MIKVLENDSRVCVEFHGFSGGERNVKILGNIHNKQDIHVLAHITSSDDIMDLLLLKDALDNYPSGHVRLAKKILFLPYLPYARQDRAMQKGEANGVRVFAEKILNPLNFDEVWIYDPHSDVGPSHIKNLFVVPQETTARQILSGNVVGAMSDYILCAPDSGAIKKTTKLMKNLSINELVVGQKNRDLSTGEITGTSFSGADVNGRKVIMVDDICDGGATFFHLGKALKDAGAAQVDLYVTHGIFSKGIDDVFDGVVDNIYAGFVWKKYVEGKNQKNILKIVDETQMFG